MALDLYCRLYIQSDLSMEDLERLFATCAQGKPNNFSVSSSLLFVTIRNNDSYDIERFRTEERFVFARFTAEVEPLVETTDSDAYIDQLCNVICSLRNKGLLVTASCEFEDVISQKTGWNWSADQRQQPPIRS